MPKYKATRHIRLTEYADAPEDHRWEAKPCGVLSRLIGTGPDVISAIEALDRHLARFKAFSAHMDGDCDPSDCVLCDDPKIKDLRGTEKK